MLSFFQIVSGLQNQLNNLKVASERFGMAVNTNKTEVMIFRRGGHIAKHEEWFIAGMRLEVVDE